MPATTEAPETEKTGTQENLSVEDVFGKQVPIKGTTEDFLKKYGTTEDRTEDPKKSVVPDNTEDHQEHNEDGEEGGRPKLKDEKKEKGFVKRQIDENRRLKEALEKTEAEKKAAADRAAELEKKIAETTNAGEETNLREELNRTVQEKNELQERLDKEKNDLQSRVDFFDLQQNPNFQREFVEPIGQAHQEMAELVSGNARATDGFERLKIVNDKIYGAKTQEEHNRALADRKELLEEIGASLPEFSRMEFYGAAKKFFEGTKRYNLALRNWQQEKTRIEKESASRGETAQREVLKRWTESYKSQGEAVEKDIAIPKEVEEFMQSNKIEFDLSADERVALLATQQAKGDVSIDDTNRLIHQGRVFGKMKAALTAMQKMLAEKEAYISKLKGSSGTNGSSARVATEEKKDMNGFLNKWGPR